MVLGSWIFRIGVASMEKFRDVNDYVISGIKEIGLGCISVNKVIGSSGLSILLDVFHLEVHLLWV